MTATGVPEVEFDTVIHSPARLKVMMTLAATDVSSFNELARTAALTAGNLATHLKALEAAGYIEAARSLIDLKPRMRYALTPAGRDALRGYCRSLEAAIRGIQAVIATPTVPSGAQGTASPG